MEGQWLRVTYLRITPFCMSGGGLSLYVQRCVSRANLFNIDHFYDRFLLPCIVHRISTTYPHYIPATHLHHRRLTWSEVMAAMVFPSLRVTLSTRCLCRALLVFVTKWPTRSSPNSQTGKDYGCGALHGADVARRPIQPGFSSIPHAALPDCGARTNETCIIPPPLGIYHEIRLDWASTPSALRLGEGTSFLPR